MIKNIKFLLKGFFTLIKKHRVYIIAPFLMLIAFLAILVFILGPQAIMAIIYAGI